MDPRIGRPGRWAAGAALAVLVGWVGFVQPARAVDPGDPAALLVLRSSAGQPPAGQLIDGRAPLTLAANSAVALVDDAGRLRVIDGPFSGRPLDRPVHDAGGTAQGGGRLRALAALLADRAATGALRTDLRSGEGRIGKPPTPWAVSVERGGAACAQPDRVTFWRTDPSADAHISIVMGARRANAVWKKGADLLPMPGALFADGRTYKAQVDGREPVEFTLHIAAAGAASPVDQAVWMASVGCKQQALMLLDGLE